MTDPASGQWMDYITSEVPSRQALDNSGADRAAKGKGEPSHKGEILSQALLLRSRRSEPGQPLYKFNSNSYCLDLFKFHFKI